MFQLAIIPFNNKCAWNKSLPHFNLGLQECERKGSAELVTNRKLTERQQSYTVLRVV